MVGARVGGGQVARSEVTARCAGCHGLAVRRYAPPMRAVVQRVSEASVQCDGRITGAIGRGLLVLAAVEAGDGEPQRRWMADKLVNLRVFPDEQGKMNLSLLDIRGAILLVSNFTVAGDTRKGRRPGFDRAMKPPEAEHEFARLLDAVRTLGVEVHTGVFGGDMKVSLVNDGPVTLVIESVPEAAGG